MTRRRRPGRTLLVTVVVLAVLAVGADRVAAHFAERAAADRISARTQASGVAVRIEGFPFLTQALRRDLHEVDVRARTADAGSAELRDVTARATDVAVRSTSSVEAGRVVGSGLLPYDALAGELRLPRGTLRYAGPGQVSLRRTVQLLGRSVEVTATGAVRLRAGRLVLQPESARLADGTTVSVAVVGDAVSVAVPVPRLLPGLQVVAVKPEPSGVLVTAEGRDVTLS